MTTFTLSTPGTYAPTSNVFTSPSTTTVTGQCIRVAGRPETLRGLELIESEAPTLLFAPDTYGEVPTVGMEVTWNGVAYVVRDVEPVAPDGVVIIARVVISR